MTELFRVERPAGINRLREEAQEDPSIWQDSNNIRFQHGLTKKTGGYEEGLGTSLVDPELIVPLRDDDGVYYWWAYVGINEDFPNSGSSHKFYRITNTIEHLEVTPDVFYEPTTGIDYQWTGDTINGVPFLTYAVPYYYDSGMGKFVMFENIPREPVGSPGDAGFDPNGGDPRVRFQTIRAYKNFMIGMNFDTSSYEGYFDDDETVDPKQYWGAWNEDIHQNAVWWSDAIIGKNIDAVWEDANSIRLSGWNFLGGSGGNIVDGKTLRDSFVIYRERSVWQMSYIGGVQVFAFKELFNDTGCLGLNCVIEIDGEHLVVGQSDVYRHNGVRKVTVVDGIVRRELFESIHPSYTKNVFIATDYQNKEAWICIPSADQDEAIEAAGLDVGQYRGSCNRAYVYNWVENTWSKKDIPFLTSSVYTILSIGDTDLTWDAESEGGPVNASSEASLPYPTGTTWEESSDSWSTAFFRYNPAEWGLAATSKSQKIFTVIKEPIVDGDNFEGVVEKTYMDMGERLITKHVSRVYPLVRNGIVDVYMDESFGLEEGITWKYVGQFDSTIDEHLACRVTGRYIHIKFVIPESSRAELRGYHVEYDFIGRR